MQNDRIILLATEGESTNIVYNKLAKHFSILNVFIEEKESKKVFLKRRIKKLGLIKVFGQVLFQLFVVKILSAVSKNRLQQISLQYDLNSKEIPPNLVHRVSSVNEEKVIQEIAQLNPSVIIVNGTRIISKKFLNQISCPIINTHTGITPKYRGVHGGYWALVNNDVANFGVTIHLIDKGIDTGNILYQNRAIPTAQDNFCTYPILQLGSGISNLVNAVKDALNNQLKQVPSTGESALWYHPTIWSYCYHRIKHAVK